MIFLRLTCCTQCSKRWTGKKSTFLWSCRCGELKASGLICCWVSWTRQSYLIITNRFSGIPDTRMSNIHPLFPKTKLLACLLSGDASKSKGVQSKSASVILFAWRPSTRKSYDTFFRKWVQFCHRKQSDCFCHTESTLLEFLAVLFDSGDSYSLLSSARSAISAILVDENSSIGEAPLILIKKFLRGVFNSRPQIPRNTSIL
ncbi:hypothetical protein ElyMa_005089500 [Elysia marginata]|uniref:Uncharacterized protein n=1 Tax=Elysia marginata TaxID=1093978 RepID=A0AAV4JHC2_9GAST|nr:hypothetical protein ElyMa_005089500 [Elysia marginata]